MKEAHIVWDRTCQLSDDFRVQNLSAHLILSRPPCVYKWEKPMEGFFKINVDVTVELDTLTEGISLARSLNLSKVNFEMDYTSVINRVRKVRNYLMILGYRIKELQNLCLSSIAFDIRWID
ncbi:hypothetical protein Goari_000749 [Gossypium aridum]|uniref:RNase H type-1 domain-containing protein n=1 Tax=Gossypium aridum TaxID=34290 RepID=A0A7J8YIG5_GOSAI|nr:hypothetical protein [Gossypium aridum]